MTSQLALEQALKAGRRLEAIQRARDDLLVYLQLIMPDPNDPDDVLRSQYKITPQARLLCQIVQQVEQGKLPRVAVSVGPQMGKALHTETPVPTPSGWTSIGDLVVGDEVFDMEGKPCRVVAKTPVWRDRPVFRVTSDDGYSVIADAEHEWPVRASKSHPVVRPKTTARLALRRNRRNPMLATQGELSLPGAVLPIDPYVLGVWLGDGTSDCGAITAMYEDGEFIEREVQTAGFQTRRRKDKRSFGVLGLHRLLRENGLLRSKHIPATYLRASAEQRLALLQGLVDTDGCVGPKGDVEVVSVHPALVSGIRELVLSLGVKCQVYERRATLNGKDCGSKWSIHFFLAGAARLPRKRERCRNVSRCAGRYLTFEPAGVADTVCVEVDSPSHTFLCGEGMLVTCNSQILSRAGPAWLMGRNPAVNLILGSYNQDFANEFGDDVRAIVNSSAHKQVFPDFELRKGGGAKDLLISTKGGKSAFVGVGGSGTGKPSDIFVVDDPIRNDDDAQSEVYRERMWNWFTKVVNTRIHNDSSVIVVHTRWHEDDLIGRLCDPDHPERHKKYEGIADEWTYINLPAVVQDLELAEALGLTLEEPTEEIVRKQFGTKPMASLWPERFSLPFLARQKRLDPRAFAALRMGQPAPEDGDYFKSSDLVEYHRPEDLPKNLRIYGASDHAVSTKQRNDSTIMGCVGIDENDDIWVLPDLVWERMETDKTVEELILKFRLHRPLLWWMESELISKSFGPFLYKRMREEQVYTAIDRVVPSKDKATRARAIQGRMRMGKVHWPAFAPWWPAAKNQLLKFPYGTHDEIVDWAAYIGQGLLKESPAARQNDDSGKVVEVGSIAWTLAQTKARERRERSAASRRGW